MDQLCHLTGVDLLTAIVARNRSVDEGTPKLKAIIGYRKPGEGITSRLIIPLRLERTGWGLDNEYNVLSVYLPDGPDEDGVPRSFRVDRIESVDLVEQIDQPAPDTSDDQALDLLAELQELSGTGAEFHVIDGRVEVRWRRQDNAHAAATGDNMTDALEAALIFERGL